MGSKFSLGDIIIYEGIIYKINSIYVMNWFTDNPIVYGLITIDSREVNRYSGKELMIREELLDHITDHQKNVWSILYGESKTSSNKHYRR